MSDTAAMLPLRAAAGDAFMRATSAVHRSLLADAVDPDEDRLGLAHGERVASALALLAHMGDLLQDALDGYLRGWDVPRAAELLDEDETGLPAPTRAVLAARLTVVERAGAAADAADARDADAPAAIAACTQALAALDDAAAAG
jgi:hypothetical protein